MLGLMKGLRKFFRRRMTPIPVTSAINKKEKLSLLYMFVSWNAFCLIGYQFLKSERPNKDNTGKAWAQYLEMNNRTVTVHTFDGFGKSNVEVIKPIKPSDAE